MLTVIPILLAGLLILAAVPLLWSPGKPAPIPDETGGPVAGSLSEKIHGNINGVEQGMFIFPNPASILTWPTSTPNAAAPAACN